MKIANHITDLIGSTPMLRIADYPATIYAKLESFNPCSSIKDRVALNMIEHAIEHGTIDQNTTIIEATSGNTGIGLAMVAASRGMRLIIVMPENMTIERRQLIALLGAEIILTPKEKGMTGANEKAKQIADETPNSFIASQFDNPSNPLAHQRTTAREIISQLGENVCDILVAGVGTGGTLTGVARSLKASNNNLKVVAVEPSDSPVLSGGTPAPHTLQGIGAGFIPDILDTTLIDKIVTVTHNDALATLTHYAKTKGVLMGISSGAALHTAIQLAQHPDNANKNIVVILPDSAERYLSTLG